VTIGDMFPSSRVAKKLEADDDATFESLIAVWMSGLAGMSDEKVIRGLKVLMASGNTFEPSVPEFVKMCKARPAAHQPYKALPQLPASDAPATLEGLRRDIYVGDGHPQLPRFSVEVKTQLTKIGMLPEKGETQHEYSMRCKAYVLASDYGAVIGSG
jgi:hypothetical protein